MATPNSTHPPVPPEWPVKVVRRPGRGRCLQTTRPVPAGAVVVEELPLIVWPEADVIACACCLRMRPNRGEICADEVADAADACQWRSCESCRTAHWCDSTCETADRVSSAVRRISFLSIGERNQRERTSGFAPPVHSSASTTAQPAACPTIFAPTLLRNGTCCVCCKRCDASRRATLCPAAG